MADPNELPVDFTAADIEIIRAVQDYTITSPERVCALIQAVRYVHRHRIPGAIVECGVLRGGSMLAAALTLEAMGADDRHLYLYDTFEGMTEPAEEDVHFSGRTAKDIGSKIRERGEAWYAASLEEVQEVMRRSGYDEEKIHFVKGPVEETLPAQAPEQISLLRLDTDWYASTRQELIHLYPRLSTGGVLLIDDYGCWRGSRKAVDEYMEAEDIPMLLNRVDWSARLGIKPGVRGAVDA